MGITYFGHKDRAILLFIKNFLGNFGVFLNKRRHESFGFRKKHYICTIIGIKQSTMEDFIHLHVHSQYSLLDGQASISKMVKKAIGNGMRGMALTDHGNMFGVKDFFDCCNSVNKDRKKEGLEPFKPIFGCEVYVARRKKERQEDASIDRSGNHLILLAKNLNGYRNLIKLVSRAWVDGFYGKPRTDHDDLKHFHEDIM